MKNLDRHEHEEACHEAIHTAPIGTIRLEKSQESQWYARFIYSASVRVEGGWKFIKDYQTLTEAKAELRVKTPDVKIRDYMCGDQGGHYILPEYLFYPSKK